MKRINKRTSVITNVALAVAVVIVAVISFIPTKIAPISSGSALSAIYKGNVEKKNVSVMFNVYENTEVVNGIIDVLNEKGVKGTFFVGGCWADDNGETLVRIVNSGHEIGNHGYFHKDHKKLNYDGNYQEISLTLKIVKALCGVKPSLFAPPSGSYSEQTLKASYDLGSKVIMWSKDTIDWRDNDLSVIKKRATQNVTNGDLILMHPKIHTLKVLPEIIDYYKESGYSVVTVSENIT